MTKGPSGSSTYDRIGKSIWVKKVNPNGLRFGINKQWISRWVPADKKQMGQWLVEDHKIRTYIVNKYRNAGIDHIEIERDQQKYKFIFICTNPDFNW